MHVHHSILDKDGNNIFSNADGSETPEFLHFIGGLQSNLPNAIALLAPYVNSYRRYVKDFAAPINLAWGRDNRTTGIRVPVSDARSRRVENRLAGMDCNPYLAIAASLACGYLGLVNKTEPSAPVTADAYEDEANQEAEIPRDLAAALDLFEEATDLHDIMSTDFAKLYSLVKRSEYEEFLQVISPWEREHLLLNV